MSVSDSDRSDEDSENAWTPYSGPRGGVGWRRVSDGEVNYDDEPPGELVPGAEELINLGWGDLMEVGKYVFGDSFDAVVDSPQVEDEDADSLRAILINISDQDQLQEVLEASQQVAYSEEDLQSDEEAEEADGSDPDSEYESQYSSEEGSTDYSEMEWVQRALDSDREFEVDREEIENEWEEAKRNARSPSQLGPRFIANQWGRDVDAKDLWEVVGTDIDNPMKETDISKRIKQVANVAGVVEVQGEEVEIDLANRRSSKSEISKVEKAFRQAHTDAADRLNISTANTDDPLQKSLSQWSGSTLQEECALLWAYMREETGYSNIPFEGNEIDPEDVDLETLKDRYGDSVIEDVEMYMDFHRDVIEQVLGDSIPVFRGGGRGVHRDWVEDTEREESAQFEHMTGASWTVDPMVSQQFMDDFGGCIWLQNVTPDEIFGSTLTGTGFDRESEVVVSGGNPEYEFVDSVEDLDHETAIRSFDHDEEDGDGSNLFALTWERMKHIEERIQEKRVD